MSIRITEAHFLLILVGLIISWTATAQTECFPCILFTEDTEFFEFKEPHSEKGFYSFVYTLKTYESEQNRKDTLKKYSQNPGLW